MLLYVLHVLCVLYVLHVLHVLHVTVCTACVRGGFALGSANFRSAPMGLSFRTAMSVATTGGGGRGPLYPI
jgi:hypothetical protein